MLSLTRFMGHLSLQTTWMGLQGCVCRGRGRDGPQVGPSHDGDTLHLPLHVAGHPLAIRAVTELIAFQAQF